jgi:metal-dependent HD superfamily phosphatase/phosphodiesterase
VNEVSFDAWMHQLDHAVTVILGVGIHDLPDMCFRDWHDEGITVPQALTRVRQEVGF